MIDYFLFNEFSTSLMQTGYFNRNFTNADIPKNIPFQLNTDFFANMLPGLAELYPGQDLILSIASNKTEAPNLYFNEATQSIDGNLNQFTFNKIRKY